MRTSLLAAVIVFYTAIASPAQSIYEPYVFTVFAGTAPGSRDSVGNDARFNNPAGVAADETGNIYVVDQFNSTIRKIAPNGAVTTLAGSAGNLGSADGTGSAARFNDPTELAIDSGGNLFVSDSGTHTVRQITPGGTVSTCAGSPGAAGSSDGTGSAARFYDPDGMAIDN